MFSNVISNFRSEHISAMPLKPHIYVYTYLHIHTHVHSHTSTHAHLGVLCRNRFIKLKLGNRLTYKCQDSVLKQGNTTCPRPVPSHALAAIKATLFHTSVISILNGSHRMIIPLLRWTFTPFPHFMPANGVEEVP